MTRALVGALAFVVLPVAPAASQVRPQLTPRPPAGDTAAGAAQPRAAPPARDSLRPPLPPGRAFLYSALLPGLAQSRLGRHAAGALYFTLEAVSLGMLAKSANDLRIARAHRDDAVLRGYQRDPVTGAPIVGADGRFVPADTARSRYDDERVKARKTHVEDWIAMLVFTHLFAGADAFVASLLWDLPARVGLRLAPSGPGVGITVRW